MPPPPAPPSTPPPPRAGAPDPAAGQPPRLSDLLRLSAPGLRAVLAGWLQGCYTAGTLDEALARRSQLRPGEAVFVPAGHAVSAHSLGFYAPDTEQSGLLAPAQDIEQLDKALRAQTLMAEEARSAPARAEAAPPRGPRAAPGRGAARGLRSPEPGAWATGRNPAPDPPGRAGARAQRADRRRSGRGPGPAGRTARAQRERRGPLRGTGHAIGRQPGARGATGRARARRRAPAWRLPRAAAPARTPGARGRLRAAQPGGAARRTGPRHRHGRATGRQPE